MTDTDIQGAGKSGDTSLKATAREGSPAASRKLDGDKKVSKHDHTGIPAICFVVFTRTYG